MLGAPPQCALPWNHQPGYDSLTASGFPKVRADVIRDREAQLNGSPQDGMKTALLEEGRAAHLGTAERSRTAFLPVWQHCQTVSGADNFPIAGILWLQSLCGRIAFSAAAVPYEMIYDKFNGDFGELFP